MKLSEYIKNLQQALSLYGDCEVITSKDAEGNGYNNVYYEPSVMYRNSDYDYWNEEDMEEDDNIDDYEKVICVN